MTSKVTYTPQELKVWRKKAHTNLLHITANWVSHMLDKHTQTAGNKQNIQLEPGNAHIMESLNLEEQDSFLTQPNWICPVCASSEHWAQNAESHLTEIEKEEIQSWVTFPLD